MKQKQQNVDMDDEEQTETQTKQNVENDDEEETRTEQKQQNVLEDDEVKTLMKQKQQNVDNDDDEETRTEQKQLYLEKDDEEQTDTQTEQNVGKSDEEDTQTEQKQQNVDMEEQTETKTGMTAATDSSKTAELASNPAPISLQCSGSTSSKCAGKLCTVLCSDGHKVQLHCEDEGVNVNSNLVGGLSHIQVSCGKKVQFRPCFPFCQGKQTLDT